MESYKSYFDRQSVSPELHEKLLAIGRQPRTERRRRPLSPAWKKWAALAACCALALGLGLWRLSAPGETGSGACVPPAVSSPPEDSSSHSGENRESGFQVEGSETTGTAFLPAIPYIHYPDVGDLPAADTSPSRMMLAGSYSVELTKEDVQKIFWGPEGKPEGADGDLPWMLFWGNFFLSGSALYDGEGELLWLTLKGNSAAQALSFTLTLRPGELPFQCGLYSDLETTHVNGTPVTGWSRREDLNGDGVPDARCVSEFMAGEVGVRFEAACTAGEDSMDAAAWYSALLVGQTLSGVRVGVDVVAPGQNIGVATYLTGNPSITGAYSYDSGTSFAAPIVSGVVSLLYSDSYAKNRGEESRDARLMKAVIINSADKVSGWDNGQRVRNNV